MQDQLWIPPTARNDFKKADPPKTGPAFDAWGTGDLRYIKLPGGGTLQFDLNKLTLDDFRSMRDHYQINASLKILTFMIHQLDWHIECEDKAIASEVERQVRARWTRLVRGMAVAFWAGYGPSILEWENSYDLRKIELNKVKDVQPERASVNWKEVKGWAPPGKSAPKIKLYDGMKVLGNPHPVPPDCTLWYPLLMESGDYYGTRLLKPAFPAWFFSQLIHLFANRFFERYGEPLPIARADYEQEVTIDGKVMSGRAAMEQILTNLRNRSVVVLPSDRDENENYIFDLEYLEGQMRGADFERYLSRLDEEMSIGLFTPVLLFRTADVGSYNLGVSHEKVFLWMLNALAGDMKEYIDEYVCERIKAINFSPRAPRCEWVPRKMGKENIELLRSVTSELISQGHTVDLGELSQAIGLSVGARRELESDDGGEGGDDDRVGRPERKRDDPGNKEDTGRQISARAAKQIRNAYGTDRWQSFVPDFGYMRRLTDEYGEDVAIDIAQSLNAGFQRFAWNAVSADEAVEITEALVDLAMRKAHH